MHIYTDAISVSINSKSIIVNYTCINAKLLFYCESYYKVLPMYVVKRKNGQ